MSKTQEILLYASAAFMLVLFLFFIDEGRFSLDGLLSLGGIVVFLFYFTPTFLMQFILSKIVEKQMDEPISRVLLCMSLGSVLGVGLVIGLFLGFR